MNELIVRFALGASAVSIFSAVAELFEPKTFSGIFGAAPAVAIVSLATIFAERGGATVGDFAVGMICGGVGFFAYACACVLVTARTRLPVWLGAALCWTIWFAVAGSAWLLVGRK